MKKSYQFLASVLILSGSFVAYASQNSGESSLSPVRITNQSRGDNNSDYKFVKSINAQSRMGTVEKYNLYRDTDDNYCVKRKNSEGYAKLAIYNRDGWSHTFSDGTTWYCNVY